MGEEPGEIRIGVGAVNSLLLDDPWAVRDYAQAAEGLGFDFLTVLDHVVTAFPAADGTPRFNFPAKTPYQDILVTLGYLAGVTERIRLRTAVVIMPLRDPIVVAKQAAAADALSQGRVDLGVGIGSHRPEYDALLVPRSERGSRLDEGVEVARALWTQERVDHHGKHYRLDGMAMEPKPLQVPHPPIWFGGASIQNQRRVALHGAGWISQALQTPAEIAKTWAMILRLSAAAGRDPSELRLKATVPLGPKENTESVAARFRDVTSLGATDVVFFTSYAAGIDTVGDHIDQMRRVAEDIVPASTI